MLVIKGEHVVQLDNIINLCYFQEIPLGIYTIPAIKGFDERTEKGNHQLLKTYSLFFIKTQVSVFIGNHRQNFNSHVLVCLPVILVHDEVLWFVD